MQRIFLGSTMGSLESWLLLRSLRTLHLRVPRQSENATALAQWLSHAAGVRTTCLPHVCLSSELCTTEPCTGKGV